MNNLQKIGGFTAFALAITYVMAFVYFGAFFDFPRAGDTGQKLRFLADNQLMLSIVNLVMYVAFGVLLVVLVLALHYRFKTRAQILSQLAAVFGVIWVGLVIASGMIANIGLAAVIRMSVNEPEQAMTLWYTVNIIVEGLGGGNEVVGGLWLLILSCAALKSEALTRTLSYFGVFIGLAGIMTIYPADVLTEIFGIGQIVWFVWLGISMLVKPKEHENALP